MKKKNILMKAMVAVTFVSAFGVETNGQAAEAKNVVYEEMRTSQSALSPDQQVSRLEAADTEFLSKLPMLESRDQLPSGVRQLLERGSQSGPSPLAWGDGFFPFTTARALSTTKTDTTPYLKSDLARGVGKLLMRFGASSWYACTASMIDKAVLVTAAHCVQDYGLGATGKAAEVIFQPMRDNSKIPYGAWKGKAWIVPDVYANGTDNCLDEAEGIVCENDLAVVVIEKKISLLGTATFVGSTVFPSTDSAYKSYAHESDEYSYIPLYLGGDAYLQWGTQMSQFGYPAAMDSGLRMLRTDSLGIMDEPSNVIIGSDQTGGSSGGPWFVNYGRKYYSASTAPIDKEMAVMAVTSWGYTDPDIKIQGASRFSKNLTYTEKSNIDSLHDQACMSYPTYCYPK